MVGGHYHGIIVSKPGQGKCTFDIENLENVRSTSVLSKIHKMFLRFLFSQSQFDHLRYNSLTLALSQKLLVNLLDPILLSLIVWPHRNFL